MRKGQENSKKGDIRVWRRREGIKVRQDTYC